ncbi:phospholipase D family protein [Desulfovibrio sp. JC010]|uniref:phospholipase D family protein n=1 Tax=Desulfovibrio sp. JC010 TaxID=2593641 RepID=UPI0013D0708F|nr:phospholipase D family protein [Desulfovibrio sp. JC010]NDV26809.1 hypothetical protein [Desulfovibrio sp. JC010]
MLSFFAKRLDHSEDILFLTTQGMNYHLEMMFQKAEKKIVIIAPFLQIHSRLKEILAEKARQGVEIKVVCRVNELKDDLSGIIGEPIDRPNLHAKCYLTEKSALIGSLNLYDFSQINNDEMGILIKNSGFGESLYGQIVDEARRLSRRDMICAHDRDNIPLGLVKGEKYDLEVLDTIFDFEYKKMSGIKTCKLGDIVLFENTNSKFQNSVKAGMLHFKGQNTGKGDQRLIFGNKVIYDTYGDRSARIHLFTDFVYEGMVYVAAEPYFEGGCWFFPLSRVAE